MLGKRFLSKKFDDRKHKPRQIFEIFLLKKLADNWIFGSNII